jgi:hypothetical protein
MRSSPAQPSTRTVQRPFDAPHHSSDVTAKAIVEETRRPPPAGARPPPRRSQSHSQTSKPAVIPTLIEKGVLNDGQELWLLRESLPAASRR